MRRIVLGVSVVLVSAGLWAIGLVPNRFGICYLAVVVASMGGIVVAWRTGWRRADEIVLFFLSMALALIAAEAVLRSTMESRLYYRPDDMFVHRDPRMPLVSRYEESVSFRGTTFGDLAAMAGTESYRERRIVDFVTDDYGFRNYPEAATRPADVIILGDSFGVGTGTTQEATWASLLRQRYGANVYNLSLPGSPWHSYINLLMESNRLSTRQGCKVLAAVFTGNDLEDEYGKAMELPDLPWNDRLGTFLARLTTYRNRSAIRQFLNRLNPRNHTVNRTESVKMKTFPNGRSVLFYKPYIERSRYTDEGILGHRNYPQLCEVLLHLRDFCGKRSCELVVLLFPSKEEVYGWLINGTAPWSSGSKPGAFARVLGRFCDQKGIEFFDLKPSLIRESKRVYEESGSMLWWFDDTHWNAAGHEVVARVIYERILDGSEAGRSHPGS